MLDYKITIYMHHPHNDYEHLTQCFKNNDITLSYNYDHHEQLYGIVFTKHIESLQSVEEIAKRLFSLQILFAINLRHLHKADTFKLHKKGVSANDEN